MEGAGVVAVVIWSFDAEIGGIAWLASSVLWRGGVVYFVEDSDGKRVDSAGSALGDDGCCWGIVVLFAGLVAEFAVLESWSGVAVRVFNAAGDVVVFANADVAGVCAADGDAVVRVELDAVWW